MALVVKAHQEVVSYNPAKIRKFVQVKLEERNAIIQVVQGLVARIRGLEINLTEEIRGSQVQIFALEQQVYAESQKANELSRKLTAAVKQLAECEVKVEEGHKEYDALVAQVDTERGQVGVLKTQLERSEERCRQLEQQVKELAQPFLGRIAGIAAQVQETAQKCVDSVYGSLSPKK